MEKHNVQQESLCPVCRVPQPKDDKREMFQDAYRQYLIVRRQVEEGKCKWDRLPQEYQKMMDDVVRKWTRAADLGHPAAADNLGVTHENGYGVQVNEMCCE